MLTYPEACLPGDFKSRQCLEGLDHGCIFVTVFSNDTSACSHLMASPEPAPSFMLLTFPGLEDQKLPKIVSKEK
ncbi:mCG140460 [Mus musculus]|nr:mCG140460 [Mus musculus]